MGKAIWGVGKSKDTKLRDLNPDILIIGAGITGIMTAYYLRNSKQKVMLIDKAVVMGGITSKTTAKITYLQEVIYQTLEKSFSFDVSKLYYESQVDAIKEICDIVRRHQIDCDLEKVSSIIFTLEEKNLEKIAKEKEILHRFQVKTFDVCDQRIRGGVGVSDTYQFHPIKYLEGVLNCIQENTLIHENVCATKIEHEKDHLLVYTNQGMITAKKVVVATHYPFFIQPLFLPLKAYVRREYVNAAKMKDTKDYHAISIDQELHSIRFYQDYLVYGSNEHRLTSKIDYTKNYSKSEEDFKKNFHKSSEFLWMNQDIVSHDELPFIGEVEQNLYVATAYRAWGMTNGVIGAKLIADLIMGRKNKYQKLFDPKRINLQLVFKSFPLIMHYMKVYVQSLFQKNNPSYIKIDGVFYGVYTDKNKKEHKIKLICPHMKCNLVFNQKEKTWDCPCHGSRFDLDGNLIEGPSTKDLDHS